MASVWSSRARALCDRLRGVPGATRRAALEQECRGDWTLYAEVVALLAREEHPSVHGEDAAAARPARPLAPTELPPDAIAGYRLGRLIGVGATGAVYEAEQVSPRRRVALKVFRSPGPDEQLRQRIAHEAEVLARLHHPHVAQVYAVHAGHAVPSGREDLPWIAMELVEGTPIDVWCGGRETTLRERVDLLASVAAAIGHAHACGVVHRDLKPGNVLVTEAGTPKVVDFGVARTLGSSPAVGTLHTRDGDLVGTVAYMSVEQVEGATTLVDTRTDVHALGVLAFQLLAGRLPRDPEWKSLPEWAHALRQPAPALRDVAPGVPTDLSLVVARALDPDRERRYPTAQAFADDLRRFLAGQPVVARAPTKGYLLRSFVRRHRALVGGALATVLALVAGLVVSLRFALESDLQRRRADREADDTRREAYRAQISVASQALASGNASGARSALDRAAPALRGWEWRRLDAAVDGAVRVLRFPEPLTLWRSLAADGSRVAGGTVAKGAVVLHGATGAVVRRVDGGAAVEKGVLTPDGRTLVLARAGGALELVDVATGDVRRVPEEPGRTSECDVLGVNDAGTVVVESRRQVPSRLRRVDLRTGQVRTRSGTDEWPWTGLAVDADGTHGVATIAHGGVERLELLTDARPVRLADHDNGARGVALSPDGALVATVGEDRQARVTTLDGVVVGGPFPHQQTATAVAWGDGGRHFATWSRERVLRLFTPAWAERTRWPALDMRDDATLAFRRGTDELLLADEHALRTWSVDPDDRLDVLRGHKGVAEGNRWPFVYDAAFSPDGRRLATAAWDGTVRVWSVATGRMLATLPMPGAVHAVAWSPDGATIVAAGRPNHVVAFDARTGHRTAVASDGIDRMQGGVSFTPDGKAVLTPLPAGGAVLRDATTLAPIGEVLSPQATAFSSVVGADGSVVLGLFDGEWVRFGPPPARRLVPMPRHALGVERVAVSPDGRRVASASDDGTARVVDAETGAVLAELRGHVGKVYAVAFSPDGTRLATGGDDATVRLHDAATGEELLVLRGHATYVFSLRFSPDGSTIASVSGDNTARLWSTRPLAERVARRDAALAAEAAVEDEVACALAAAPTPEGAVEALRVRGDFDVARRAAALDVALRRIAGEVQR